MDAKVKTNETNDVQDGTKFDEGVEQAEAKKVAWEQEKGATGTMTAPATTWPMNKYGLADGYFEKLVKNHMDYSTAIARGTA